MALSGLVAIVDGLEKRFGLSLFTVLGNRRVHALGPTLRDKRAHVAFCTDARSRHKMLKSSPNNAKQQTLTDLSEKIVTRPD